jgi:phage FluMu protein Com
MQKIFFYKMLLVYILDSEPLSTLLEMKCPHCTFFESLKIKTGIFGDPALTVSNPENAYKKQGQ